MERRLKKNFTFFLNLVLFIQLYSIPKFSVEAIRSENLTTCVESYFQNETAQEEKREENLQRPKRPARLMPAQLLINEDEDEVPKTQNITDKRFYGPANSCVEIAKIGYTLNGYYLVRGNTTINYRIEVLGCKFKHSHGSKEVKEEKVGLIDIEINTSKRIRRSSVQSKMETELETIDDIFNRQQRPARLLPLRMILGEEKNKTENGNSADTRFYGPATSCDELGKLGYTLNGLYLVDCKEKLKKTKIEVIECRFKQPHGSKKAKEERIGFVKIKTKETKRIKRRYLDALMETGSEIKRRSNRIQRPIRLLPPHILYGKQKNDTEGNQVIQRFYGPPNNCSELKKLGYTLNGYYLVNGTAGSQHVDISLCKFHQPPDATGNLWDESFVLVPTEMKEFKLLPLYPCKNESYPLMNVNSGRCVDGVIESLLTEKDCNSSKLINALLSIEGKQLGDINSHKCVSVEPLGATTQNQRFVLVPKASYEVLEYLPLDHGRNESYPLMNAGSGKCLDEDNRAVLIETDCNPSTTKRWKLVNDGKQLCDMSSAKCMSVKVLDSNYPLKFDYLLYLAPMLRDESEKQNCQNCCVANRSTQHLVKSSLKYQFTINYQGNGLCPYSSLCTIKVQNCGPLRNQTLKLWFFVSFE